MNIIFSINIVIMCVITSIFICIIKHICLISKIIKEKHKAYFKLNLLEQIIDIELLLVLLCGLLWIFFFINKEVFILNVSILDILINVGCSLLATAVLSIIIYYKFLKHIPDETKSKIDDLLNDRLGYETTNHNAVLKKSDDVQSFLAREHSEIRQSINSAKENIASFYSEFNTEKELKKMRYDYLKDNDKSIVDSINKISLLGESLEKLNCENLTLKEKNRQLIQENIKLKNELTQYQQIKHNNYHTQSLK